MQGNDVFLAARGVFAADVAKRAGPALVIGRGDERRRLRWNLEALQAAILKQMGGTAHG